MPDVLALLVWHSEHQCAAFGARVSGGGPGNVHSVVG